MYKNTKIICFDLDGVLINSIKNMSFAWKMTCVKNNIKIPFSRYKKFIIGIITSKNKIRVNKILKKLKIKFDFIYTPDDLKRGKPHPDAIIEIKKKFNVKSSEIIYLGDTKYDLKFSKNSKINFLFAKWGYGSIVGKKVNKIKKISEIYNFL